MIKIKTINKALKLAKLNKNYGLWQDQVHLTPFWLGFLWLKEVDFLLILIEWIDEWLETMAIDFKSVCAIGIQ